MTDQADFGAQRVEVNGTATAKVSFKDLYEAEAKAERIAWSSDNPLFLVTPDVQDPTTAHIVATGAGRATITATGVGSDGIPGIAQIVLVAMAKGGLSKGVIKVSTKAAPERPVLETKSVEEKKK